MTIETLFSSQLGYRIFELMNLNPYQFNTAMRNEGKLREVIMFLVNYIYSDDYIGFQEYRTDAELPHNFKYVGINGIFDKKSDIMESIELELLPAIMHHIFNKHRFYITDTEYNRYFGHTVLYGGRRMVPDQFCDSPLGRSLFFINNSLVPEKGLDGMLDFSSSRILDEDIRNVPQRKDIIRIDGLIDRFPRGYRRGYHPEPYVRDSGRYGNDFYARSQSDRNRLPIHLKITDFDDHIHVSLYIPTATVSPVWYVPYVGAKKSMALKVDFLLAGLYKKSSVKPCSRCVNFLNERETSDLRIDMGNLEVIL